jgi:hypothetical protein
MYSMESCCQKEDRAKYRVGNGELGVAVLKVLLNHKGSSQGDSL